MLFSQITTSFFDILNKHFHDLHNYTTNLLLFPIPINNEIHTYKIFINIIRLNVPYERSNYASTATVTKPQHTIQRTLPINKRQRKQQDISEQGTSLNKRITKVSNIASTQNRLLHKYTVKTYYPGKIINLAYANQLVS